MRAAAAALVGAVLLAACSSGEAYEVGAAVKAPLGGVGAITAGSLKSLYGELGQVEFADGSTSWAPLRTFDPPGKVSDPPDGDRCDYAVGTRVWARPAANQKRQRGSVVKTHGKMALVLLEKDSVTAWGPCADMRGKKTAAVASGGEDGPSAPAAATGDVGDKPCVFRPDKGRYVHCTQFSMGKCRAGSRVCKPRGKCVFSASKGKYVKCSAFSRGRCAAGSVACKPSSKCVYRPEKGKHVKCGTFTQGKCKSGASACRPW